MRGVTTWWPTGAPTWRRPPGGAHLADPSAILIIDATGCLKKGTQSAGVQRQSSGSAGQRENCPIGVLVASSRRVRAPPPGLVDREVSRPPEWAGHRERRQAAGVPEAVTFTTTAELARRRLARVGAAGRPAAWVTGDTVSGGSGPLRAGRPPAARRARLRQQRRPGPARAKHPLPPAGRTDCPPPRAARPAPQRGRRHPATPPRPPPPLP